MQLVLNVPPTVIVGQQLTVVLSVSNNGTIPLTNVVPPASPLVSGWTSANLASGPVPASAASVAPGSAVYFTWIYNATAAGTVGFQAGATSDQGSAVTPATGLSQCIDPTPTFTRTVTPTSTRTPTSASTPTLTYTPTPEKQEIKDLQPYPNPVNPAKAPAGTIAMRIAFNINQTDVDIISIRIYTASYRLIRETVYKDVAKTIIVSQRYFDIAADTLKGLANGTYYYYITADKGGKVTRSKVDKIVILK
jgi:hypothetical protein